MTLLLLLLGRVPLLLCAPGETEQRCLDCKALQRVFFRSSARCSKSTAAAAAACTVGTAIRNRALARLQRPPESTFPAGCSISTAAAAAVWAGTAAAAQNSVAWTAKCSERCISGAYCRMQQQHRHCYSCCCLGTHCCVEQSVASTARSSPKCILYQVQQDPEYTAVPECRQHQQQAFPFSVGHDCQESYTYLSEHIRIVWKTNIQSTRCLNFRTKWYVPPNLSLRQEKTRKTIEKQKTGPEKYDEENAIILSSFNLAGFDASTTDSAETTTASAVGTTAAAAKSCYRGCVSP